MKQNLEKYLPKPKTLRLFQCDIEEELITRVKAQMKADGLNWRSLVKGLFQMYLDDRAETTQPDRRVCK